MFENCSLCSEKKLKRKFKTASKRALTDRRIGKESFGVFEWQRKRSNPKEQKSSERMCSEEMAF